MSHYHPGSRAKFIGAVVLGIVLLTELFGRLAYRGWVSPEEDHSLRIFLGLEYRPNATPLFVPHHYLVYTLNPTTSESREPHINSLGFRGPEFSKNKPRGTYRVICLGGSTTFGTRELDDSQTYPALLERKLNQTPGPLRFEVINAGVLGWTSAESLINLQFRVLELSPDMVIDMEGVNDAIAMRKPDEGGADYSNFRQIVHFRLPGPFLRQVLRYSLAVRFLYLKLALIPVDINSLAVKPSPPGFDEMLAWNKATGKHFRRNIETIVDIAKARGIKPVLITSGHGPWHSSLMVTKQIVRAVARAKEIPLVDFEHLAKPEYFIDDHVHLLHSGNQALVQAVFETLQHLGPPFPSR
jgi:lysophospholipase L1-like esterase